MFENFNIPKELFPSDPRFGCGPSLIPVSHVEKLLKTGTNFLGTSHRKSAVKNVVKSLQDGLKKYFNVPSDYLVVLGNGGATLLFDMLELGLADKKTVHFTCGEFSEKWYEAAANIPQIKTEKISVPYGEGIDGKMVEGADMVCVTLNETSTGVQLSSLPVVGENTLLAVDATSGAGQVPCDVSKTDIFFFSPQKVFASDGGLFVAIMSPKALKRALDIEKRKDRYIPIIMRWSEAISNSEKNQTYNTPSLATIFLMDEQVKVMNQLGYDEVVRQAQKKAELLYSWAREKDYLSCYVKDSKYRSVAVATIDVSDAYPVDGLIAKLEKEKVAFGIDAYRKLNRNQFRISLFHNIKYEDLEKLIKIISTAIESV